MIGLLMMLAAGQGYWETGNSLLRTCASSPLEIGCIGYITGVADTAQAAGLVCIPIGADRGQAKDIVVKYLTDHPETRQMIAPNLVINALKSAFPCSPQGG